MKTREQQRVEDHLIDLINKEAGGRLVIYKPENSALDLVVEKRGDYKDPSIGIKIFPDVAAIDKTLPLDENLYILIAGFDMVRQDIQDTLYLIPSRELSQLTETSLSQFKMSKDKLGAFLIDRLP